MRQGESKMSIKETGLIILHRDILSRGRHIRLRVKGDSMLPMLRDGDVVDVLQVSPGQLRIGDLLLIETKGGGLLLHRYLTSRVRGGRVWLITKGDASREVDTPISPEQVRGRVVQINREGQIVSLEGRKVRLANYALAKLSPYRHLFERVVRLFNLRKLSPWFR